MHVERKEGKPSVERDWRASGRSLTVEPACSRAHAHLCARMNIALFDSQAGKARGNMEKEARPYMAKVWQDDADTLAFNQKSLLTSRKYLKSIERGDNGNE